MPRRKAHRFTQAARERFLLRLGATANVREAARAAGVNDATVYLHRLRDPAFAHEWRMALLAGYDRIELALIRRALGLKDETQPDGDAFGTGTGTGAGNGGGAGDGEAAGELDVELALKLLTRHKPVVAQATAEAVAATFRASRDAAADLLLANLRAYAKRHGLEAPSPALAHIAEPALLLADAAAPE